MDYLSFLQSKIPHAEADGFEPLSPPNPALSPHAAEISLWSARGGRRAVFANFGLHKTRMNLQIGWWVAEFTGGKFLIIAPLGVRQEFTRKDGPAMGYPVHFVKTTAEVDAIHGRLFITNYESVRDGKIDLSRFAGCGLDESSCLRSFGSKTYQTFLAKFKVVPYRFCFTATPSPNRLKELIHYAAFLGIMDSGQALTRFFQRDSSQAGNLTLYPHMEAQFYHWLSTWAVFMQKPSDRGYSDAGYDRPQVHIHWHELPVDHTEAWSQADRDGQSSLFLANVRGLKSTAAAKRGSIDQRVIHAGDMVAREEGKNWIIWHDLESERHAIEKAFPTAQSIYGTRDLEERENIICAFSDGELPILATKPSLSGSGCNFQKHCSRAVFLGVGYKFNDFIQAVHRIDRYGQTDEVHIHIIYLESERDVRDTLERKWAEHDALVARMTAILRKFGLSSQNPMELIRSLVTGAERTEVASTTFRTIHNDTVLEMADWPENAVHHICTSIPFGTQYEYSPTLNDFGHNVSNREFFQQMDYCVPHLLRVLKPGRIAAIHVKDRIEFGNVTGVGFPTVNPFSDHTVAAFTKHGFQFVARITIDTDVVRENAQTYRLTWSENAKDGTKMGAGMPEYVLIFRKLPTDTSDGYADVPVVKPKEDYTRADWQLDAAGLWKSDGNRLPDPDYLAQLSIEELRRFWISHSLATPYRHEDHVHLCQTVEDQGKLPGSFMLFPPISRHPDIWTDILRISTLNSQQAKRNEEKHVCPLQLDIIRRLITRYTNKGDIVFDPFGGIGSVPYQAIKMGRTGWMTELNAEYWRCAVGYCEAAENELRTPTLFDLAGITMEGAA